MKMYAHLMLIAGAGCVFLSAFYYNSASDSMRMYLVLCGIYAVLSAISRQIEDKKNEKDNE